MPETIMEQHFGNCMDMSLLYAGVLESMGLHPVLYSMEGHIYTGYWLYNDAVGKKYSLKVPVDNQIGDLLSRIHEDSQELVFVECTNMCGGDTSYQDAENQGTSQVEADAGKFECAIDVNEVRSKLHVMPLPSRMLDHNKYRINAEEIKITQDFINLDKKDLSQAKIIPMTPVRHGKRALWESKLLNLKSQNPLLSMPTGDTSAIEPFLSSHLFELEDLLSDGEEFHLDPWPFAVDGPRDAKKECGNYFEFSEYHHVEPDLWEIVRDAYSQHILATFKSGAQLEKDLRAIYLDARSTQEERGSSSLYMGIGILKWFDIERVSRGQAGAKEHYSNKPSYAPLILMPIEMIRKSAKEGYSLKMRSGDSRLNLTLVEKLRQDFNLDLSGLIKLPEDDHGVDVRSVFATIRKAISSLDGWDVVETGVIGNFDFNEIAMWNDLHSAPESFFENSKIVRSLIKGHVDWQVDSNPDTSGEPIYIPNSLDDTQLKAVKMAGHGATFVLHGPPGTGKSQTITAMIFNLLARGKSVLFMAEKEAALNVVQERLKKAGIGNFCLEVHSAKANKKKILSQLDAALESRSSGSEVEFEEKWQQDLTDRERIDLYSRHLHQVRTCGYSLHDLVDRYENISHQVDEEIRFRGDEVKNLTKHQISKHVSALGKLTAAGSVIGDVKNNPLISIGLTEYYPEIGYGIFGLARRYVSYTDHVLEVTGKIGKLTGVSFGSSKAELQKVQHLIDTYRKVWKETEAEASLEKKNVEEANSYFNDTDRISAIRSELLQTWDLSFLDKDVSKYQEAYEQAEKKFFGRQQARSTLLQNIRSFTKRDITYDQIPQLLTRVREYQKEKYDLQDRRNNLRTEVRQILDTYPTRDQMLDAYKKAQDVINLASEYPGGIQAIKESANNETLQAVFEEYEDGYAELSACGKELNEILQRQEPADCENWLQAESIFFGLLFDGSRLNQWTLYRRARKEAEELGLGPVVDAYENGFDKEKLIPSYLKGMYHALILWTINHDSVLYTFSGASFNEEVRQFKELDENLSVMTRKAVYDDLAGKVPLPWSGGEKGTQIHLLKKAIGTGARGITIRSLFEQIPDLLSILAPCMLMSPDSVAQYLPQKNDLFDVVIFDEASQLTTAKSIGALARAKDAVIVGDPKQMPPTSFFSGNSTDIKDLALQDMESILDDALALGVPSMYLKWHYRSQHESLIAFSNKEFYGNGLFTFPSADDRKKAVTAYKVPGAVYKRGDGTNEGEAKAIIEEVVRRYHLYHANADDGRKQESIGIVTFNMKQMVLIQNLLNKEYGKDPGLDKWGNPDDKEAEPLFVKNLENVQGDERDVILFSIGYGPDEKGYFSSNFGPINQEGGAKRLNVAFSRARKEMRIFTSFHSSELHISDSSPEGLKALQDFLKFAESSGTEGDKGERNTDPEVKKEGILLALMREITQNGYQCTPHVGQSDFYIDLAVSDPNDGERYMLGILLDSNVYKNTVNTRDREYAQEGVLRHLGWNLCRIWTMDWVKDRDRVLDQIFHTLDELKAESYQRKKVIEETKAAESDAEVVDTATIYDAESSGADEDEKAVSPEKNKGTDKVHPIAEGTGDKASDTENTEDSLKNNRTLKTAIEVYNRERTEQHVNDVIELLRDSRVLVPCNGNDQFMYTQIDGRIVLAVFSSKKELEDLETVPPLKIIPFLDVIKAVRANKKASGIIVDPAGESFFLDEGPYDVVENINSRLVADIQPEQSKTSTHSDSLKEPEVLGQAGDIILVPYEHIDLPVTLASEDEYLSASFRKQIAQRAQLLLKAEAPILMELLVKRVLYSFGQIPNKSQKEATEKAIRVVLKPVCKQQRKTTFVWKSGADPDQYHMIRVISTRSANEICRQEVMNSILYALSGKQPQTQDELMKNASKAFGYSRLGSQIKLVMTDGIATLQKAKKIVKDKSGGYRLAG